MVIDTSALLAIILREAPAERLQNAVLSAPIRRVAVATVLEASLVLVSRLGEPSDLELEALIRELTLDVVPVTTDQLRIARDAGVEFGKGRHAAGLNYGDLFSYALARSLDEPLLFIGDDFGKTDVMIAAW